RLFRSAARGASVGRSAAHRRLSALVRLREMGGLAFDAQSSQRWSIFDRAVGDYEDLSEFSEDERAYEIASALGAEAGELSVDERFIAADGRAQAHFSDMARRHGELVRRYPRWLTDKQEVVALMLELTSKLWGVDGKLGSECQADEIIDVAARGTTAALQRSNAIFYCQMMIARAVAARQEPGNDTAFVLAGLVADSLKKSRLTLDHEGLKVLRAYLRRNDPTLADYLTIVSTRGAPAAKTYLHNQPLSESRSEEASMAEALVQVIS